MENRADDGVCVLKRSWAARWGRVWRQTREEAVNGEDPPQETIGWTGFDRQLGHVLQWAF